MLEASLVSGAVPVIMLISGLVALTALVARPGHGWWLRSVPLAFGAGALVAALAALVVDVLWRPFPDPLPFVTLLWTAVSVAALLLAVLRIRSAPRPIRFATRVLPVLAAALVLLTAAAQVNQLYYAYPTLRAALQLTPAQEVPFAQVPPPTAQIVRAQPGVPLATTWMPSADMPAAGTVSQIPIPGPVSGFAARPAWVYLPPSYLSSPRALLPVLVLVAGQPGSPRDWLDGGRLVETMDAFAAAHFGLAPVVVVPDPLGSQLGQTLCVDSSHGRAFTYLTADVPAWIIQNLQVDKNPAHWAIGGVSAGGTCALQLAVNAPSVYPTFLDLSGPAAPTVGSRQRTVVDFFAGDLSAYRLVNPLDVLSAGRLPPASIAGAVVTGTGDSRYGSDARRVRDALTAARMDVHFLTLPGGHSWQVWAQALPRLLPFVAVREGLTPG